MIYGRDFSSLSTARFGQYIYKIWLEIIQTIVSIPMGTNCAPLVADLFLFCYERDFMLSMSDNNQTDIIEALTPPPDILNKW